VFSEIRKCGLEKGLNSSLTSLHSLPFGSEFTPFLNVHIKQNSEYLKTKYIFNHNIYVKLWQQHLMKTTTTIAYTAYAIAKQRLLTHISMRNTGYDITGSLKVEGGAVMGR
jgi:hypothetical protein